MKAGIAVDNYKLQKYEDALYKNEFLVSSKKAFTQDTSILTVVYDDERHDELDKLVRSIEAEIQREKSIKN